MPPSTTITVNTRWRRKQAALEVEVTRVSVRGVSYIALEKTCSGTLPQWQFLAAFQPVQERKKRSRPHGSAIVERRP